MESFIFWIINIQISTRPVSQFIDIYTEAFVRFVVHVVEEVPLDGVLIEVSTKFRENVHNIWMIPSLVKAFSHFLRY